VVALHPWLVYAHFAQGQRKEKAGSRGPSIDPPSPDCSTEHVSNEFDKYWSAEMELENPSVLRALFRAFGAEFVRAGFLKLVHDLSIFVGPQVLHAIIAVNPAVPTEEQEGEVEWWHSDS
jgi:hypothetical protein